MTKNLISTRIALALLLACSSFAFAAVPDLTGAGVIAALKSDPNYSNRPYSETYNLGPTGLRGWIYIDGNNAGDYGLITAPSRQILVTVASTPASAVLAVDDVILGTIAANSGVVPAFTSDCRKALGVAIGDAEKTGAGTLRISRWRAGVISDVNIPMTIMGDYTATSPYTCPKSALVLANARIKLVSQLKADSNFLSYGYGGAINGLALLASVAPGDADYAIVQTRLKTFADALAANTLQPWGQEMWTWSYMNIFLSEYYLRSVADGAPDASVLAGISRFTVAMAKAQSRYGTFSHGGTPPRPDGSLHGTVTPYGPVNAAGIPTNIAIVMGKKALVAGSQAIDPEIDPAIQRGSDFFSYYMNKGSIPYGEHEPWAGGHSSNGKDSMCAVFFGLQDTRSAEAEYFSRMSVAGCTGREYGHTGQGFSYLWGAMGANIGGPTAVAKYMENFRWHTDLARRTDGSFAYDGQEQYGGGGTADGSYLGKCGYNDINPTATYLLSFGVSLQRLYITGRNAIPANTLSPAKVDNAMAAATYKLDCPAFTTAQLLAALSEYDPVVRNSAAAELASRTLTTTELNNLIASITNGTLSSDPSTRMGACQALGARQASGALTALGQRLSDTDLWVRGKAAQALRMYGAGANGQRDTMLTAFAANATDPEVIVWNDPVQIANNFLSFALFGDSVYGGGNIAPYTISAAKNLLYPAVRAGLKQPDSNPRLGVSNFTYNYLTLADAQALTPNLFAVATTEALADTMWHGEARAAGIQAVAKFKPAEAIAIALSMMEVEQGYGWGAQHFQIAAMNVMSSFGDAARWTLPALRQYALIWDTTSSQYPVLNNTIASIEAAITSPAGMINLVAVATPQVVVTPVSTAKAITLTGVSPRGAMTFTNVTTPAHGTLTGTAPNLIYTPTGGYTGPDYFTFRTVDSLTTSDPGTVSIIVGTAGTGLKGEYFDNTNFINLKLTRTDQQLNFDWGTGSPDPLLGADTFSVRWSGQLLVPETGSYTFSTLNSDGARLFINGVPVINDYVDQTTSWKDGVPVSLTAGQRVELQMEYYENTGSAVAKLKWRGPTLAGINGSIITKEWLYDGTGITNRTPYAHAQTVSLVQNSPQVITLTGSGVGQTPLVYSVITQPAYGTLTGAAPNLTYTPAANYSGSDSFTFLVNNGTSNSAPATVSIGIWAGSPTSYFWTNAVAGNWSGSFWSNSAGGAVTPAVGGNSSYSLNFDKAGTYTTTQDLNNNYLFNQLNLAGNVTFAGTNSLALTSNGSLLPQINQNSANSVTFNTPINLAAMTSFGGVGGGSIEISGVISGSGGVNKDCPGTLQLYGLTPNPYSGGTIVNGGTLHLGAYINGVSPNCVNPAGAGSVTLNSGGVIQFDRVVASNALTVNGGTLHTPNGWGAAWSGAITLNGTVTINTDGGPLTCSGIIGGAGGFTKAGTSPLYLSGNNSFSGAKKVTVGTLSCSNVAALGTGSLDITLGAMVALNYSGSRTLAALTFNGGSPVAPGTYGSTASSATNPNNTYFSGTGTITILPSSSTALALTSGSTPSSPGTPLTFTATVTGTSPTGSVAFYDGTALLGSSALNGAFQASFTTSSLVIGSHSITAKYVGNATNASSSSAAIMIDVTSLTAAPPTNLYAALGNNNIGLTWTTSAGATSYYVKRSLVSGGSYIVIGNPSTANFSDLTATNGTPYFYVVSARNAAGESANSSEVTAIPAAQLSSTTLTSSLGNAGVYGDTVAFTATVGGGSATAVGSVTFKDGATVLGSGTLDGAGQATYTSSALTLGSHLITATFSGDVIYGTSVSPGFNYAVSGKPVTITGLAALNKAYDGTTAAALTGGSVVGVLGGDTVTVVAGSGTFANANAGTWAVTVSGCSLGGSSAGNYLLSAQPTVANATITARSVVLTGSRLYDGTVTASGLSVANNVDGVNLGVTGSASLAGKDVGSQAILINYATPVRVRIGTGNTGTGASTSFSVTMAAAPVSGNTMVAVISTRGSSADRVTAITQTGAIWSRTAQATNTNGTTTEIWVAPNVSSAGTGITITQASLRSAAVVMEYSGVLAVSPTDQANNSTGSSVSPVTGTTATTIQANELWVGGIGFISGTPTLGTILNSFAPVISAQSISGTAGNNAKVYALERIVNTTGTASSGGTLSASAQWSGAIATFKAATTGSLTLTGSAAGNYTLVGMSGTMTITPKALSVTGLTASAKVYDGLSAATLSGTAAFLTSQAAGAGTTSDGKPYTGDALALGGTAAATFADPNVATAKAVSVTGLTLTGTASGNYTLTQPVGLTANITASPLTVTASNQSKTYGQTVNFGSGSTLFTSSGLQNSETIGSVTLTCTGGGAAAAVASYPITPSTATSGTFAVGNYSINYVDGILTVDRVTYQSWATQAAQGLTPGVNDSPSADPDGDGISNLMEFALGGAPMVCLQSILPTFTKPASDWVFEYDRSDAAQTSTTQVVEYGSDLTGWTPVVIPTTSAGIVTITPGSPSDHVVVTLPVGGGQQFVRLKVSQ